MKGWLNNIILYTILCCCFFSISYAKEGIESINIDIYINENGDAEITEVWECEAYSGTEWYHPYYNLGNSKITNLSVSENGKQYEVISKWDTKKDQEYKKEKCGINKISDGIEICWGMGDYGKHEYQVKYTIENFVSQLKDSQMIYWTLLPHNMSDAVDNASIKIYADKSFENDVEVYGFGEDGGVCRVNDGYIEMKSKNGKMTSEYMTILGKFPIDFFNSNNKINKNFDYYYQKAIKGTVLGNKNIGNNVVPAILILIGIIFIIQIIRRIKKNIIYFVNNWRSILKGIAIVIGVISIFVILLYLQFTSFEIYRVVLNAINVVIEGVIVVGLIKLVVSCISMFNTGIIKERIREKDVEYYREIPCDGDLFLIYFLAHDAKLLAKKTDFLGAILLKWIKEKKIILLEKKRGSSKDGFALNPAYTEWTWDRELEKVLYESMFYASKDGIFDKYELTKWCNNPYSVLSLWFDSVLNSIENELKSKRQIKSDERYNYKASKKLVLQAKQLCGLKKYLKEFSLIHEREVIEVKLFEEYLIVAQILGIAEKVSKQFKKLYPNVIEQCVFSYDEYIFINTISNRTTTKKYENIDSTNSISFGGDSSFSSRGSSFSGGGRGSHGGGSRGGGGRR